MLGRAVALKVIDAQVAARPEARHTDQVLDASRKRLSGEAQLARFDLIRGFLGNLLSNVDHVESLSQRLARDPEMPSKGPLRAVHKEIWTILYPTAFKFTL